MQFQQIETTLLVTIPNEHLDSSNARPCVEIIHKLPRTNVEYIVIDMPEVVFMDSMGLGVLLSLYKHYNAQGKDPVPLYLRDVRPEIEALIATFRLSHIFPRGVFG